MHVWRDPGRSSSFAFLASLRYFLVCSLKGAAGEAFIPMPPSVLLYQSQKLLDADQLRAAIERFKATDAWLTEVSGRTDGRHIGARSEAMRSRCVGLTLLTPLLILFSS